MHVLLRRGGGPVRVVPHAGLRGVLHPYRELVEALGDLPRL